MSAPRRMDPVLRQAKHQARIDAVWPPARVAELTQYIEVDGLSYEEAGRRMGLTKNAAIGKARRLGLESPNATGPRDEEPPTLPQRMDALDIFPARERCCYPVGHPREPDFHFCGAKVSDPMRPYCDKCVAERKPYLVGSAVARAAA